MADQGTIRDRGVGHRQRRAGRDPGRRRPPRPRAVRGARRTTPTRSAATPATWPTSDRTLGVAATDDVDAVLGRGARRRRLRGVGRHPARRRASPTSSGRCAPAPWSSPRRSTRSTTRPTHRPSCATRCVAAAAEGGGVAVRVGHRPGLGQRHPARCWSPALAGTIDQIRCQEIFDYTTYDQPDSVRYLVGMGQPMDYEPPMVAPDRADHGVGRADPPDRPGARRRARRDPRDARCAARSSETVTNVDGRRSRPAPRARCASRCRASSTASR